MNEIEAFEKLSAAFAAFREAGSGEIGSRAADVIEAAAELIAAMARGI